LAQMRLLIAFFPVHVLASICRPGKIWWEQPIPGALPVVLIFGAGMSARIGLWVSLVALTALIPGLTIGLVARSRRWPAKRCRRATFLLALCSWIVCGGIAQYAMHTIPWVWVVEAPWARWMARGLWFSAVLTAPMAAQKIANPATKLPDMRYW